MENTKKATKYILPMFLVDAFAKQAFSGNGAAICPLNFQQVVPDDVKQKIANEMNLSETAYISVIDENETFEKGKCFGLRWFTPTCEVSLCGHATLASAAVLFSVYNNPSPVLEFQTASGLLKAKKLPGGRIEINLPAYESTPVDMKKYEAVVKAAVGSLPYEEVVLSASKKLVVRLKDTITRQQLQELKPSDSELLAAAPDIIGIIITLKGSGSDDCVDDEGNKYDFISRYFVPWLGVSEDPVTGSAHSVLAPFWSKILNKNELYARQCSPRGGDLRIQLMEDRVAISGHACIVVRGQIHV